MFERSLLLCGLAATACSINVPLEGKRCAATEPRCLTGYACVDDLCVASGSASDGGSDGGTTEADAGCALDVDPAATSCPRDVYYLDPNGNDTNDGRTPATARRTIGSAQGLNAGDEIRLAAGTWTTAPVLGDLPSARGCPILISGAPDGGTRLTGRLRLSSSYTVLRGVSFAVPNANALELTTDVTGLVLDGCRFASPSPSMNVFPTEVVLGRGNVCTDCLVRGCTFESGSGVGAVDVEGPNFEFRGNQVRFVRGDGFAIGGTEVRFEGNDFSGSFNRDNHVRFGSSSARVAFNVFHDVTAVFPDKPMLSGSRLRVSRNTFVRIRGNQVPLVDPQRFDDNLVTEVDDVLNLGAPASGDHNIFDPTVTRPYLDGGVQGSDRIAAVDFEPGTFVPRAGTAAIDGADPSLPVPSGGGAIADVGALERGANRGADGRYCLADGGL